MIATEDHRVQRSKRLLTDAMIALVLEKDFEALTIQEICDRADVGKHTFYRHFKDKTALMYAALDVTYYELLRLIAEARDDQQSPVALKAFFAAIARDPKRYLVLFQGAGRTEFHRHSRLMLEFYMGMQMRRVNPGTNAPIEFITKLTSGIIFEVAIWWLENGQPYSPEYVTSLCQRLLGTGVMGAFNVNIPHYHPELSLQGEE